MAADNRNTGKLKAMITECWEKLLIRLFVDNLVLDKYWCCHQKQERSFFVRCRQFHLCARCTGIFTGYCLSPLFWWLVGDKVIPCFIFFTSIMAVDGLTQLWEMRESVNLLRFITGLGFGLTFIPFCIKISLKLIFE